MNRWPYRKKVWPFFVIVLKARTVPRFVLEKRLPCRKKIRLVCKKNSFSLKWSKCEPYRYKNLKTVSFLKRYGSRFLINYLKTVSFLVRNGPRLFLKNEKL